MKSDKKHDQTETSESSRFKIARALGPLLALGVGLASTHWIVSGSGVDRGESGRDHQETTLQVGEKTGVDQSMGREQAAALKLPMPRATTFEGTPLEEAIAAARLAVRQMSGNPLGESGSQTFGDDPATQVTVRAIEDGKVSLGPAGGNADWGMIMAEEVSGVVGYETLKAYPNLFSLMGTRLFSAPVARNEFETISGNTLTDSSRNFEAILTSGRSYAIELESGAANGKVLKVVSVSGSSLTVEEPLTPGSDIAYTIRPVLNLSDLFGSNPGLVKVADFNPDTGDLILIPSGDGHFDRYFYSSYPGLEGFFNAATGLAEDPELVSTEGLLFLRRGATPLDVVISGSVKVADTLLSVSDTFSYFSSIYPAGETFAVSNLEASLQAGTAETADLVWIDAGAGAFQQYFYSDGTPPLTVGWRRVGAEDIDQGNVALSSGFAIHRRAAASYDALLTPPSFYSEL